MYISRYISEIRRDIPLHERAVDLSPLMVYVFHDPHAPGNGNFIANRRRLYDRSKLFRTGTNVVLNVLLEHGVEFIIVNNAFSRKTEYESAVFRSVDMIDLQQVSKQYAEIVRRDTAKRRQRQHA